LHHATLADLQTLMRAGDYDFGIAFDGDADRVGFLDERGDVVPMDAVTALVAQELLTREKGVIFYDLRSSRAVREVILENGGTPMMSRVGHTFIKQQMRDTNAIFAGELSGHYYFRENFFAESASMAVLCVANVVSRTGQPFSRLIAPLKRYVSSGEINSTVTDPAAAIARIRARFKDRRLLELDGLSVEDPDGWFNVRVSNTEPLIRLNVEARTRPDMEARRDEVLAMIRGAPPAEGGGANA
jgi:phosphomannomutase